MKIADIMRREVFSVEASNTFAHAAAVLRREGISSVLVMEAGALRGIITERDVVALVAEGADPRTTTVGERMSTDLGTVDPSSDVADAAALMAGRRIRHLPVVAEGRVVGVVSIRDLTSWAMTEITEGHELADIERSHRALAAAAEVQRSRRP